MRRTETFRAAVLECAAQPVVIRSLEIPKTLSVGQVLVRIKYSGICGAQLNEISGVKGPDMHLPHLLGHEGGGVVVACGPGVRNVKPRDHVIVHWRKGVGIESLPPVYWCPQLNRDIGGGWCTTWNEISVVSENRITKINGDVPLDIAALLGCAVTTGLGIIVNDVQLKVGQSIVVYGCGGVGLNVIQGAFLAGAYPIVGIDITDAKVAAALAMGATHVRNIDPSGRIGQSDNLGLSGPPDVIVDTTGNPDVIKTAWETVKSDGKVCLVAQMRHDTFVPLQTLPMHHGKTIFGSDGGGTDPAEDIPRYLRLYKAGRLNLDGLITHRTNLDNLNSTLDLVRAGQVGRAVIKL